MTNNHCPVIPGRCNAPGRGGIAAKPRWKFVGAEREGNPMISINGVSGHVHSPCPRCGYATRFKQWPIRCLCNRHCSNAELERRDR